MIKTKYFVFPVMCVLIFAAIFAGCGAASDSTVGEAALDEQISQAEKKLEPGTSYMVSELLYFSGDDTDAIDPNNYYTVSEDGGIHIGNAMTGELLESQGGDSEYTAVDEEEWTKLFSGGLTVDISAYTNKLQYQISDTYLFYFMDDEVWLGTYNENGLTSLSKMEIKEA